jgi:hypothetical protein
MRGAKDIKQIYLGFQEKWPEFLSDFFVFFPRIFIKISNIKFHPPRRYPYFDVVVGLVWSHDPKSYAGGSVCYW